jgi:hypothetical protein
LTALDAVLSFLNPGLGGVDKTAEVGGKEGGRKEIEEGGKKKKIKKIKKMTMVRGIFFFVSLFLSNIIDEQDF